MIRVLIFSIGLFFIACNQTQIPPSAKTAEFKVWGNCGMCKKTIENSIAGKDGLIEADWNKDSKMIRVTYDSLKTDVQDIQQMIAMAGYDNEAFTGDSAAYSNLHECCQYTRK